MEELSNTIQIVGLPGVGKSFFLNCLNDYGEEMVDYIEFSRYLQEKSQPITKTLIRETIDEIIENYSPAVFTSHLIFKDGDGFEDCSDSFLTTRSMGYIYLFLNCSDILERRISDNSYKKRDIEDIKSIEEHMQYSINKLTEIVNHTGASLLMLNNRKDKTYQNLCLANHFVAEIFWNGNYDNSLTEFTNEPYYVN